MTDRDPIAELERGLAEWPAGPVCIAFSGGMDSTALLHACAGSASARARGLTAVHVDHGLHADSANWAEHCRETAGQFRVPLSILSVQVDRGSGAGLEAAARQARYAAIEAALPPGTLVLAAHHADDQAETVLLRLLRGAGIAALAAMRPLRPLGSCLLARPWLALPRSILAAYVQQQGLQWLEDPANARIEHDRNYLRQRVVPILRERWSNAGEQLAGSARLLALAADQLARATAVNLAQVQGFDPATLRVAPLLELSAFERAEVLRAWVAALGLTAPDAAAIRTIERTLLPARVDAAPRVAWPGAELRRYRGWLWAMVPLPRSEPHWTAEWDGREELILPAGLGRLSLAAPEPLPLQVRFRSGGERINLAHDRPSQSLKHLLQELGVPPWQRARLPLVFRGEKVWAAGDLAIAADFAQWLAERGATFAWRPCGSGFSRDVLDRATAKHRG